MRITGGRMQKAIDLISETYCNVATCNTSTPAADQEFVKWFSKCMKNRFIWPDSSFNKIYRPKEYPSEHIQEFLAVDTDSVTDIELGVEDTNEATRELIDISSSLGKKRTLKYIEVIEFKRSLLEYEKILFELYFEKDLSSRRIAEMYSDGVHKMNYQSVNSMVNIIKTKIKKYEWKQ